MAAGGGGSAAAAGASRSLQDTPTWALATVCLFFISLGILIEHLIHLVTHWLKKKRRTPLLEAVEKLKSVLMLLGFMSLILAVTQRSISKICVPNKVADYMLPCNKVPDTKTTKSYENLRINRDTFFGNDSSSSSRFSIPERRLAGGMDSSSDHCASNKTSLISQSGLNQLNMFIFALAVMQIVSSVTTMALGRAKMRRWKAWERETQTVEYEAANDPNRFRFTRQTTFARRHMSACVATPTQLFVKCFFRQFFHSVAKVDYLTLRHGFISAHLSANRSFNFQKYIQKSLEDDFKVVVGIRPMMWFLVVIFLLVDVHGWHVYLWVSFLPLILVLVLGTKLEVIVARMALQVHDQNNVIKGAILVRPNDKLFWFSHPQFVLTLLHYTLFMNAFELAFFVWVTLQFGIKSCYHEHIEIIVIRVVLAVMVQVLCSYITLPLYALVTQMGSKFKSAVLEEHTVHAIKQWHADAKKKHKKIKRQGTNINNNNNNPPSPRDDSSINTAVSPDVSSHRRRPTFSEFVGRGAGGNDETESTAKVDNQEEGGEQVVIDAQQEAAEYSQQGEEEASRQSNNYEIHIELSRLD